MTAEQQEEPAWVGTRVGDLVDGVEVLGALSPSRAGDFKACPLLYRFRTVDRLPEPPSPAAVRGTVVHKVLEDLFDHPAAERTPATAATLVPEAWAELAAAWPELGEAMAADPRGAEAWLEDCERSLERYFTLEDPRRLEPAHREEHVEALLPSGLLLRGVVDRIDVAPDGAIRVVDYKTGSSPAPGYEARALFQLRFYALVLWRSRGRVPALLRLMYLGDGETVSYAPDEDALRATERLLLALWEAIRLARETGDFQPSPGAVCGWCAHQPICPAHGGTPPPWPPPAREPEAAVEPDPPPRSEPDPEPGQEDAR